MMEPIVLDKEQGITLEVLSNKKKFEKKILRVIHNGYPIVVYDPNTNRVYTDDDIIIAPSSGYGAGQKAGVLWWVWTQYNALAKIFKKMGEVTNER